MKLFEQTYQATLRDPKMWSRDVNGVAEVRMWGEKWVADARITSISLEGSEGNERGVYNTKPEAQRALAQALRKLADLVESDS